MEILERRLRTTVSRVEKVNDPELLSLTQRIAVVNRKADVRLGQLRLLRWMVRLILVSGLGGAIYFGYHFLPSHAGMDLDLELKSWGEAISVFADLAELTFLLIPLLIGVFLIERVIDRAALLWLLAQLELFCDQVYDRQFDDNPYQTSASKGTATDAQLFEFLDCCTALLLLIRMVAQKIAQEVNDRAILDRCAIIRRGAGDNHTRILMKISILKGSGCASESV